MTQVLIWRQQAARRLQELVVAIENPDYACPDDELIDDLLRVLSRLPSRPTDKKPYASLFPAAKISSLTAEDLMAIAPYASISRLETLTPHLIQAMAEFEITTPLRQAHFLAQLAHESGSFNYLEEIASGEDYEFRDDLGNTQPGDGVRFKGRGLIQITGRHNYKECGAALGVDLIGNPQSLSEPDLACRSAAWYWHTRSLNEVADLDDVYEITLRINGGTNGYEDRKHFLKAAKQVLKASFTIV